jgi:acetylornithine deacetylase/succinyl-diaminopimelate desuccinylase-like protein
VATAVIGARPASSIATVLAHARAAQSQSIAELQEFVRIPSVSGDGKHAEPLRAAAEWLARRLKDIGLDSVRVVPTAGNPIVVAEWRGARGRPTVLIYGHYDVQPADPVARWTTPPFSAHVRDERLFGRGASDDKGQLYAHVVALRAYLASVGRLPVNVVCLFEGEEETGSANLGPFLTHERERLRADAVAISDMPILGPDRPSITYAMRGGVSMELEVEGPRRDVHSGLFGGAIGNPLQGICEILSALHDRQGRVRIPHFYTDVRRWSIAEREYMARVGPSDRAVLHSAGATQAWGEPGYTAYERVTIRPALTINGVSGGYTGQGSKAVIPSRASAKLNIRLVPDQDPFAVERQVRRRIAGLVPPTLRANLRTTAHAWPSLVDRRHPAVRAASVAYANAFGVRPVFVRNGGTIPAIPLLQAQLGAPTVLMGFALPDANLHAPDESLHLPTFWRGVATCAHWLNLMAAT